MSLRLPIDRSRTSSCRIILHSSRYSLCSHRTAAGRAKGVEHLREHRSVFFNFYSNLSVVLRSITWRPEHVRRFLALLPLRPSILKPNLETESGRKWISFSCRVYRAVNCLRGGGRTNHGRIEWNGMWPKTKSSNSRRWWKSRDPTFVQPQ